MKTLLNSIFLLILNFSCLSQTSGKENLNLVFYSECSDKIIKVEFEIDPIPESKNLKLITYYVERGEWISSNTITIDLNKKDTIRVPKILLSFGNELHTKRWSYLNCNEICNGKIIDLYSNGNKRLEGSFVNGKPKEIKFYRENGIIETEEIYNLGKFDYKRQNYFNSLGELIGFETYEYKKKKRVIKRFNEKGKLLNELKIKK
jgi:hypothetical protein